MAHPSCESIAGFGRGAVVSFWQPPGAPPFRFPPFPSPVLSSGAFSQLGAGFPPGLVSSDGNCVTVSSSDGGVFVFEFGISAGTCACVAAWKPILVTFDTSERQEARGRRQRFQSRHVSSHPLLCLVQSYPSLSGYRKTSRANGGRTYYGSKDSQTVVEQVGSLTFSNGV